MVKMIKTDDLVVDVVNMRRATISVSDDFLHSLKLLGVQTPLNVRPAHCSETNSIPEGKFGIYCGAQRYRGGVMLGFEEFPCIVKELSDYDARVASIQENYLRNPPEWYEYTEDVKELYRSIKAERSSLPYARVIKEISKSIGITEDTTRLHLKIWHLPEIIKTLFKKNWSKKDIEMLKAHGISGQKIIGQGKALLLAEMNSDLEFSHSFLVRFVRRFLNKNEQFWKKAINILQDEPNIDLDEIEREVLGDRSKKVIKTQVDLDLFEELQTICVRRNKSLPELIAWILKEWIQKWDIFT